MLFRSWVADDAALAAAIEVLLRAERYALDTEFQGERSYYPTLALLQISDGSQIWLVDPLACDVRLVPYLDMVGKIHTARAGNPEIEVPLVQMNALMGFLSDVIAETIAGLPLDPPAALRTMRAFQKFLWIQNDFITRQYTKVAT